VDEMLRTLEAVRSAAPEQTAPAAALAAGIPHLRLVLFPEVPGPSLHDLLDAPRDELESAVSRAGRCAARFHAADPDLERRFDLGSELGVLRFWHDGARILHPAQAASAAPLLERIAGEAPRRLAGAPPPRLIHRDLYDKQFLVGGSNVRIVDLDTACLGDPAQDVGNFLAHTVLRGLQRHGRSAAFRGMRRAFLEAYGAEAEERALGDGFEERVALYETATLLRLALLYSFRPRWRRLFGPLLDAARQAMDRDGGGER
jgi:Ser/Thr protein kinase RdoA (MazF antagonist)